ncbi:hypothetical protein J4H86_26390 [Spiractinospora alimapuensis]|nr:hypothetical protein J4H86_26390 [Spiractinospora alimapuensis]
MAIATAAKARGSDEDEPLLITALESAGLRARPVVWDDATTDWSAFGSVVVRSTWDYPLRRREFLAWADRVGSDRLRNGAEVLWWNTDKVYLRALARHGVAIVPTTWIAPDAAEVPLPDSGEYVVKPSVSAGSRDTARYVAGRDTGALEHVRRIQRSGRYVMVQPYVASVDATGETALVYLDGTFSHAVRKAPLLPPVGHATIEGLFAPEKITPQEPTASQRAAADHVVAVAHRFLGDLLYARVDLVDGPDGTPLLLELELSEPSLFLTHAPGSADRLAAAIATRTP